MTQDEFDALLECRGSFALWLDPDDERCGWVLGNGGIVEWTIGKACVNPEGHWDPKAEYQLVKQHRNVLTKP